MPSPLLIPSHPPARPTPPPGRSAATSTRPAATAHHASTLTAPALARSAGAMTFLKFAGKQLFKPEMSPFTIGGIVAFLALGSLSLSSDKAAREASPFVTPKKHH